jgi:hypothetical protein
MNSSGEQQINHRNDLREPLEHRELRAMNYDQREEWKRTHTTGKHGMWFTRIDGHLVACGTEPESDDMLARFLMAIARPEREPRTGGMG